MIRVIAGVGIALAAAVLMTVPAILGVATWKWVLGLVGLAIFVSGGRRR